MNENHLIKEMYISAILIIDALSSELKGHPVLLELNNDAVLRLIEDNNGKILNDISMLVYINKVLCLLSESTDLLFIEKNKLIKSETTLYDAEF